MSQFNDKRLWGPTPRYERVKAYKNHFKDKFYIIAGPCSVESKDQIDCIAKYVADCGATHLRGGVFRAGTYPGNNFGYVEMELIEAYANAAAKNNLENIIEILDYTDASIDLVKDYASCFQVGCRQMQNYSLLKRLSRWNRTVFLKRHPGSTLDEWLGAAEYLLAGEKCSPVLIERGSVSHLNHVRWDLSISMIPAIKKITQIPVICDPSHGTGRRDLVEPMALAGVAAGADGVLIETHINPELSLSDADQAINEFQFRGIIKKINQIRGVLNGRKI